MAKAAVAIPAEPIYTLPRFKSLTLVQLVPFQSSVFTNPSGEGLGGPPNATAEGLHHHKLMQKFEFHYRLIILLPHLSY